MATAAQNAEGAAFPSWFEDFRYHLFLDQVHNLLTSCVHVELVASCITCPGSCDGNMWQKDVARTSSGSAISAYRSIEIQKSYRSTTSKLAFYVVELFQSHVVSIIVHPIPNSRCLHWVLRLMVAGPCTSSYSCINRAMCARAWWCGFGGWFCSRGADVASGKKQPLQGLDHRVMVALVKMVAANLFLPLGNAAVRLPVVAPAAVRRARRRGPRDGAAPVDRALVEKPSFVGRPISTIVPDAIKTGAKDDL
uniref:Uncharacterized protein n=1 Tax=Oryza sativa subsp. japonica TaxID=39947 RepID=Q8GVJ8_ORYSJ|nr:hypothetical protein [Oryza sativa Japonica Group]